MTHPSIPRLSRSCRDRLLLALIYEGRGSALRFSRLCSAVPSACPACPDLRGEPRKGRHLGFPSLCSGGSLDPCFSSRPNPPELEAATPLPSKCGLLGSNATISLLLVFLGAPSALFASPRYLLSCLSLFRNFQLSTFNFLGICFLSASLFSDAVGCRLTAVGFFSPTSNSKPPATNFPLAALFSEAIRCRLTAVGFFTTPNSKLPTTDCLLEVLP
jgi:hypothetical protein